MRRTIDRTLLARLCLLLTLLLLSGCSTKNWTARDWYDDGYSLQEKGNYREAITAYTRSIEKDPTHAVAYQNRGYCHSTVGNYRQALEDLNKVLSLKDGKVPERDTYREIGVVYFRMGKFEDAAAAWKKGLGKAKDDPGLLNNLAVAYLQLNLVDKASEAATAAFSVDPSLPEVLNTLGEVAMAKKEYRQAANLFVQAIDRGSVKPIRYFNAALAFEKIKEYGKAREYVHKYLEAEQNVLARQKAYELAERLRTAGQKGRAGD